MAAEAQRLPKVAVISLGGTIACAPGQGGSGLVPADDPTATIPTPGFDVLPVPWSLTDSTEITFDELTELAGKARDLEEQGIDGIVVTQGTDSIDEVAWTLSLLKATERPIVVTGAMRSPTTPGSDAAANLNAAVAVACMPGLAEATAGAVVVMNNQIHSAKWVQKNHTQNTDAFSSAELGVLGVVSEGVPVLLRRDIVDDIPSLLTPGTAQAYRVPLVPAGLDADSVVIEALPDLGCAGLVVEGLGGGHVSGAVAVALGKVAEHMPVVFAARPRAGAVLARTYGSPGAELDLQNRGCLPAGFLTGPKARILLVLLLRSGRTRAEVEDLFRTVSLTQKVPTHD